jgi:hypothetical protein
METTIPKKKHIYNLFIFPKHNISRAEHMVNIKGRQNCDKIPTTTSS